MDPWADRQKQRQSIQLDPRDLKNEKLYSPFRMDSKNPYPAEIINLTSELYQLRHPRQSNVIYLIVVLSLIVFVLLLPCLYIDVSIKSPGIIRAITEVTTLKSTSAGLVKAVFVNDNAVVNDGQLLIDIQSPVLEERIRYLQNKVAEANSFLKDLQQLIHCHSSDTKPIHDDVPSWSPATSLYYQSLADYHKKKEERQTRFIKVKRDHDRNQKLFDQRVISQVEYEGFKFELDKAIGDLDLLKESQLTTWQLERRNFEKEAADYQAQLIQTQQEKENLKIKAPVKGTLQNLAGIYPGSSVYVNQSLAEISPDADLRAEIYVSPADIGLLHEGMEVRMQINAFNYNQWGLLTGKISEIPNDIQLIKDHPIFEVRCTLDQDYLKLKNGYQGSFKKGMTLQARFVITKRSLWQLLYDKVDDWVNPNIKNMQ